MAGGITYIFTWQGWVYLATVGDQSLRLCFQKVTIQVVGEVIGVQGFPLTAVRMASKAVMPFLRAVET
jgi:hypothetical protein